MVPAPSRVSSGCFSALELARRLTVGVVERPGPAAGTPGPPRPRPQQMDRPPSVLVAVLSVDRGRLRWSPGGLTLGERLGWPPGPVAATGAGLWITLGCDRSAGSRLRSSGPDAVLLGDGRLWLGRRLRATVATPGRVLAVVAEPGQLVLADAARVLVAAGLAMVGGDSDCGEPR